MTAEITEIVTYRNTRNEWRSYDDTLVMPIEIEVHRRATDCGVAVDCVIVRHDGEPDRALDINAFAARYQFDPDYPYPQIYPIASLWWDHAATGACGWVLDIDDSSTALPGHRGNTLDELAPRVAIAFARRGLVEVSYYADDRLTGMAIVNRGAVVLTRLH